MAFSFAKALQEQNQFLRASPVHDGLLARYRALAQENPVAYRPDVALDSISSSVGGTSSIESIVTVAAAIQAI